MTIRTWGANGERITLTGQVTWSGAAPAQLKADQFSNNPVIALGLNTIPFLPLPTREVFRFIEIT